MTRIPPSQDTLRRVKETALSLFENDNVRILVFGSRARGDNRPGSDVDIGLISEKPVDTKKITLLREKLEMSNIPYTVDVVDLNETSPSFKEHVLKEAVIWKH